MKLKNTKCFVLKQDYYEFSSSKRKGTEISFIKLLSVRYFKILAKHEKRN